MADYTYGYTFIDTADLNQVEKQFQKEFTEKLPRTGLQLREGDLMAVFKSVYDEFFSYEDDYKKHFYKRIDSDEWQQSSMYTSLEDLNNQLEPLEEALGELKKAERKWINAWILVELDTKNKERAKNESKS